MRVTGIVTAADLTRQFGNLARPFVLIEEIESRPRSHVGKAFTVDELRAAIKVRSKWIDDVASLSSATIRTF
jgi:restriction system protein